MRLEKMMFGGWGVGTRVLAGLKRACPVCVVVASFLLVALVPSGSTGQTTPCRAPNKMYEGQCLHPQKIAKLKKDKAKRQAEADRKEAERQVEAEREEAERQAGIVTWVRIPGGTFQMGSVHSITGPSDKPVHSVNVETFKIAKTETTVAQYRKCVEAGVCTVPGTGKYCNWGKTDRDNHPVNCIDWGQASAYAEWVDGRLPTEAEWEYAARSGGREQKYPWGEQDANCSYAVMRDGGEDGCGPGRTWPVCSKLAGNTSHGLCDMSGNVWEWTQDVWHENYTGAPSNGSAWEDTGAYRVYRGGSWTSHAGFVLAAVRGGSVPGLRSVGVGLRPARSVDALDWSE